jgi:hypothetical protein
MSMMNVSRSPKRAPPLAAPVACGVRSEETDAKNEDIAEMPGRLMSLMTGVGRAVSIGSAALAVTEDAVSTLTIF